MAFRLKVPFPPLEDVERTADTLSAKIASWGSLISMLLEYAPGYITKLNALAAVAADADRVALEFVASHEQALLAFPQAERHGEYESRGSLDRRQILIFQSGRHADASSGEVHER